MHLPGSSQVALAKRLLEQYPWQGLQPDPYSSTYAAGIPGKLHIIYLPQWEPQAVEMLEPGTEYRASFFNPITGERTDLGVARAGGARYIDQQQRLWSWPVPKPPNDKQDWVLILEAIEGAKEKVGDVVVPRPEQILEKLATALDGDFGLSETPGFGETGLFLIYMTGRLGKTFNFADSGDRAPAASQMWLARRFKQPLLTPLRDQARKSEPLAIKPLAKW
jgi:hypothetical protein